MNYLPWRDISCPNCGEVFKNPILTKKRLTGGFSIYPLGTLTCSKCGYSASSFKFRHPKPGEQPNTTPPQEGKTESSESDSKKLDESRFERL